MAAIMTRSEINELCKKSRSTGSLTLQGAGLKKIPPQVVHPFDNLVAGESSQYVVLLTRLNLQDNEIDRLPRDFGEIGEELHLLAMRGNQLEKLPKCISGCAGLKSIDLSRNLISEIESFSLPVLATLDLSNNK